MSLKITKNDLDLIRNSAINQWKNTPANALFSQLGRLDEQQLISYSWFYSVVNFLIVEGVITKEQIATITQENK